MSAFRYWLGRYWLAFGCCPACNSSPPRPSCPVCRGSYDYGLGGPLPETDRQEWLTRWNEMRRGGAK